MLTMVAKRIADAAAAFFKLASGIAIAVAMLVGGSVVAVTIYFALPSSEHPPRWTAGDRVNYRWLDFLDGFQAVRSSIPPRDVALHVAYIRQAIEYQGDLAAVDHCAKAKRSCPPADAERAMARLGAWQLRSPPVRPDD